MHRHMPGLGALSLAALMSLSSGASGELALSANDGKAVLIDGVNSVPANPPADSVTVIDLNATPPTVVAELPRHQLTPATGGRRVTPSKPSKPVSR